MIKLSPLIDYCRNTMHCSDAIISELCRFKKVLLKGNFYSSEFNRKFHAENATFLFEKDKSKKGSFQICVNGVSLIQWFRTKMNEWRENLSIPTKQNKGIRLWKEFYFIVAQRYYSQTALFLKICTIFAIGLRELFPRHISKKEALCLSCSLGT